jgi:NAD(P)-dependent dehydrogenase (short-subunit alcohol dehydrogenase family)
MEQRVAVVTGASQGLGLALARELAAAGWRLVIDARRADRLEAARRELAESTVVEAVAGDVTDPQHRAELARRAGRLGRVGLVVNNASTLGASPLPPLAELDAGVLRRTLEVNAIAPIALLQALAPVLAEEPTVLDITSDAAVEAYPTWGGYGASKAALEQLGRVLAVERPRWRVLSVDPGDLRTELHQAAFPGEDISDRTDPADVAPAVVALATGTRPSGRYRVADLPAEGAAAEGPAAAVAVVGP